MTIPIPVPEPADPAATHCDLCGSELAAAVRCPTCGLYRGGFVVPSRATLGRLAAAFAAVYAVTILVVLLAR